MAGLLVDLAQALGGLAQALVRERLQGWQHNLQAAVAREQRRIIEALLLLGLGLVLATIALCGLFMLAWQILPPESRRLVMGLLLGFTLLAGLGLLTAARDRARR